MAGAREQPLIPGTPDSGMTYQADYPDPENEPFTAWKAGTIPRHQPSDG